MIPNVRCVSYCLDLSIACLMANRAESLQAEGLGIQIAESLSLSNTSQLAY